MKLRKLKWCGEGEPLAELAENGVDKGDSICPWGICGSLRDVFRYLKPVSSGKAAWEAEEWHASTGPARGLFLKLIFLDYILIKVYEPVLSGATTDRLLTPALRTSDGPSPLPRPAPESGSRRIHP
jgi:hypothetical protein